VSGCHDLHVRGAGEEEREGEGEGERRECYWAFSPTSMLYMQQRMAILFQV